MNRVEFINNRVYEHYEEVTALGYEVVGVFLQGSQNYNLDEYSEKYMSDFDTKCVVLPRLDDLIYERQQVSKTYVRANNEHIDIKDIRTVIEMFKKQNYAYIEILFTDFKVVNPKYLDLWDELAGQAEAIARLNFNQTLRCFAGASAEKLRVLEYKSPAALDKVMEFGYDPKQLHHIVRMNDFMHKYIANRPYKECLIPADIERLMNLKKGILSLEDARAMAIEFDCANNALKEKHLVLKEPINYNIIEFVDKSKAKFIKRFLISEIKEM